MHTTILFSGSCAAGKDAARALHVKLLGDVRAMFYAPAPRAKSLFGDVYMVTIGFPYLVSLAGRCVWQRAAEWRQRAACPATVAVGCAPGSALHLWR